MPKNELVVSIDPEHNMIKGVSKITLPAGRTAVVDLSGLKILSAAVNDMVIITGPETTEITFHPEAADDILKIGYEAEFHSPVDVDSGRNPGVVQGNSVAPSGIWLSERWYPSVRGLSIYNLTAELPGGFEGISEAEQITVSEKSNGRREFSFSFPHPLERINFIADRYVVEKDAYNGTEIYAYFLPEDRGLSKAYIEYTKKYLEMYEKMLGKYAFKRFAIVENFLPTGYAVPTFTLLGQDVVRLPFIVETSLGHEILHEWFGNMVYVDYSGGNWSEGLTTYLADHMFEEIKGKGLDYRKQMLISFQSYVSSEKDFPLTSFSVRTDRASGAVGYGKAAMVFHMLKNLIGDEIFFDSLRGFIEKNRFRHASWNDVKDAFEGASGRNLDWFFRQWLEDKGAPELEVGEVELRYRGSKAVVSFEVHQKGKNYNILLPVLLRNEEGETRKTFQMEKETVRLELETEGTPLELIIDGDYDLFRRPSEKEMPPVISRLLGDDRRIFVIPKGKEEDYSLLSEYLKGEGFLGKKEEEIKYEDIKTSSLIIYGTDTGIAERLFGKTEKQREDFYVLVRENPFNKRGVIAVVDGTSPQDMAKYIRKTTHYGKYSRLSFKNWNNTLKETKETQRGIRADLPGDVLGIEIPRIVRIRDIIDKISAKKIVYVGEAHDRFEHHRVQFEVIRELHRKNKNIAIGMEMFHKPFQKFLDDYISGVIEEKEFLKKSEYFKRWGFDYNLYREILLYAREFKIPVIAMNIRKEVVSKVSREGLYALSGEELKEVPGDLDLSDSEYSSRLREFFSRHKKSEERNFDFFYQAQVLWDEAMAHNLNDFIKGNPERQVVVIAGMGHLAFGSGIPRRAYRLNREEYSVILNGDELGENIADFVMFPEAVKYPESPKLMVQLKEETGNIKVSEFLPDSVSEKAGLRKGDTILMMDDTRIGDVEDIKIFLLDKKRGDEIMVRVSRQRFIFGPEERNFKVTL